MYNILISREYTVNAHLSLENVWHTFMYMVRDYTVNTHLSLENMFGTLLCVAFLYSEAIRKCSLVFREYV